MLRHAEAVFNAADFTVAARTMRTDVKVIEMKHDEIEEWNKILNMYSVFKEAVDEFTSIT